MILSIEALVEVLGGPEVVGDLLGIGRTGVATWSTRGYIPKGWHLPLAVEIKRLDLVVDPGILDLTQEQIDVLFAASQPPIPARRRLRSSRAA